MMDSEEATHRYHVTVHFVQEIDPDRVDEWIDANFDRETERITVSDLTAGNGAAAPIVADVGPAIQDMVFENE